MISNYHDITPECPWNSGDLDFQGVWTMNMSSRLCDLESIDSVNTEKHWKLEELLSILSYRTRLAIISLSLQQQNVCACELQSALGLGQTTASTHLQKLYPNGILGKRSEWRYTLCSIKEEYRDFLNAIKKRTTVSPPVSFKRLNQSRWSRCQLQ